jgi:hypothetical protein
MRNAIESFCAALSLTALIAGVFSWLTILEAMSRS